MAFVPLLAAAGIATYSVGAAQSNLDAKNLWKNTVNGINTNSSNSGTSSVPYSPNASTYAYGVKPPKGPEGWEGQNKHPLALNAIDNINVKIQEINSRTKIRRKAVPTIPGVTKDLPYTTFGMANNPSKF